MTPQSARHTPDRGLLMADYLRGESMKMRNAIWMLPVLALMLALPTTSRAQERDRDLREARRLVEEAQQQLTEALRNLREASDENANRALRRAMEGLMAAQRELGQDRVREIVRIQREPGGAVVFATRRPMMGVVLHPSSPGRDSLGVELMAVTPGGPADEAGLKVGDVIVRAKGEALARRSRRGDAPGDKLIKIIRELNEGDTLRVEYRRGGETRTANVMVREMEPNAFAFSVTGDSGFRFLPSPEFEIAMPDFDVSPRIHAMLPLRWLDIELATLDAELGQYFGTSKGLLVVRGPRDESLQLKSGDVILTIDGREPTSPSHAIRILRSYEPGETVKIEVMRNKRRTTLTATVPARERGFLWDGRGR